MDDKNSDILNVGSLSFLCRDQPHTLYQSQWRSNKAVPGLVLDKGLVQAMLVERTMVELVEPPTAVTIWLMIITMMDGTIMAMRVEHMNPLHLISLRTSSSTAFRARGISTLVFYGSQQWLIYISPADHIPSLQFSVIPLLNRGMERKRDIQEDRKTYRKADQQIDSRNLETKEF